MPHSSFQLFYNGHLPATAWAHTGSIWRLDCSVGGAIWVQTYMKVFCLISRT
jgi:hypothetical protein